MDEMGKELRFSQLPCGAETTFALTDTGDVYGWGVLWYVLIFLKISLLTPYSPFFVLSGIR